MAINLPITTKYDPRGANQAMSGLDKLSGAAKAFSITAGLALAGAAAGLVAFGASSVKAAAESESVSKSLMRMAENSQAFASASGDVGKGVKDIMAYTQRLSELIGVDDEIINGIVRSWMAVPDLASKGVKGIENMVQVVADVAAGTGKDIESIGLAFVKVAGDEETAMSKLARAGIVFTDSQKATYQSLLDTSGEIAAQDWLIQQLGDTYKGAAEAAADPFARLQVIFQNLQETVGVGLLPFVSMLADKLSEIANSPEFATFVQTISDNFAAGFDAMSNWIGENGLPVLQGIMDVLLPSLELFGVLLGVMASTDPSSNISGTASALSKIGGAIQFIADTTTNLANAFNSLPQWLKSLLMDNPIWLVGNGNWMNEGILAQNPFTGHSFGQTMFGITGDPYWLGTNKIPVPMTHAEGGIVTQSHLGIVGERGPEAIIPLSRAGEFGLTGGGGSTYNITVQAGVGDPVSIGQQVVSLIKRYERANGPVFANA